MDEGITSFMTTGELSAVGFGSVGSDTLVSRKASFYGANRMRLGNNIRIDDFCVVSGPVTIGDYVHIAAFCGIYGGRDGVEIADFANISARVLVYAASDDFSGNVLMGPTVPDHFTAVINGKVTLERHVIIGAGSVVLPGVTMGEGGAIGAMSLVRDDTLPWSVYVGIPATRRSARSNRLLDLEVELRRQAEGGR